MKKAVQRWWNIFKHAGGLWLERNAFLHSGSLAFYTLFSMAPVIIIAVTVAGTMLGEEAARGEIVGQIEELVGPEGARAIEDAVASSRIDEAGILPTLLGLAALIVGATTVFAQLQLSLNSIWGVIAKPQRSSILIFLKNRVLSFAVVLTIGFILLVSLLLSVAVRAVVQYGEDWMPFHGRALATAELAISFLVITVLFASIFKILPDVHVGWSDVWAGAVITTVLFILGRYLIALYLTYTAPSSTYGAAGSLVLVLLWVYYSSLILLFGAALTKARALASGKEVVPRALAVLVRQEIVEQQ